MFKNKISVHNSFYKKKIKKKKLVWDKWIADFFVLDIFNIL